MPPKRRIVIEKPQQMKKPPLEEKLDEIKRRQRFWVDKFRGLYCPRGKGLLKLWGITLEAMRRLQDNLDQTQIYHFHECENSHIHLGIDNMDSEDLQWMWLDNRGFTSHAGNCRKFKISGVFESRETLTFSIDGKKDWLFIVPGFSFDCEEFFGDGFEKSFELQNLFLDREVLDWKARNARRALRRKRMQEEKEDKDDKDNEDTDEEQEELPYQEIREVVLEQTLEEGICFQSFLTEKLLIEEEKPILEGLMKELRLPIPAELERLILNMF